MPLLQFVGRRTPESSLCTVARSNDSDISRRSFFSGLEAGTKVSVCLMFCGNLIDNRGLISLLYLLGQ